MPDSKDKPGNTGRNTKGQFVKGRAKTGGRKIGTPNKSGNVRDRLKEQVQPYIDNIQELLIKVQREEGTKEMLTLVEKFMPYFMPKYSAVSLSTDMDRPISEEQRLVELNDMYTKKDLYINIKNLTIVNKDALKKGEGDTDPDFELDFDVEAFLKKRENQ